MNKVNELFQKKLHIVNFGIESFYEDLKSQKQEAIHVDCRGWKQKDGVSARYAQVIWESETFHNIYSNMNGRNLQ